MSISKASSIGSYALVAIALSVALLGAGVVTVIQRQIAPISPFQYDNDQTRIVNSPVCPGDNLEVYIVGKSLGLGESPATISFAVEDATGMTVFRPPMPNTLRFPAAVLAEKAPFVVDTFSTQEFFTAIGSFPILKPGHYLYRHQVVVDGYQAESFSVPFEVIPCD